VDGDGHLFASSESEAAVYDVSDPSRPALLERGPPLGRILTAAGQHLLAVQGNELVAYTMAARPEETERFTIAHGLERIVVGSETDNRVPFALTLNDHGEETAWFGTSGETVRVGPRLDGVAAVCLGDRYAYWLREVADRIQFEVVDIGSAPEVTLEDVAGAVSIGTPGHVLDGVGSLTGVACGDGLAFLATDAGVHVVSVAEPHRPALLGRARWSSWWRPGPHWWEWDSWTALQFADGLLTAFVPGVGSEVWAVR
jgi:hypothetical protein